MELFFKNNPSNKAFTITEIIVVIVIISIVAAFAVPNYFRSVERAHQTNAIEQLKLIHSAQNIYFTKNNNYYPSSATTVDLTAINSTLAINIIPNGMTYTCTGSVLKVYQCNAVRDAPSPSFTIRVTQAVLSSANPSCVAGSCP